jgi:hypothetical protein
VSRHLERDDAPRADSLKKYADALGVSVAWLGYGRTETPLPASGTVQATHDPGVGLVGPAALAYVLRDYTWPSDVDMAAIDAAELEARESAQTQAGLARSPSAWRAYLERLLKQKATVRPGPRRAV